MQTTYCRTDLFQRAIAEAGKQTETVRNLHEQELAGIPAKIAKAEAAIERYYDAFEAGTFKAVDTERRIVMLGKQIDQLRARQHELTYELEALPARPPSREELTDRGRRVRQALAAGPDTIRRSLVHALVEEIRVTSRDDIVPVFRAPSRRIPDGAENQNLQESRGFDHRSTRCT